MFSLQHCHPLITTDTFRIIITFKGELLLSKCNCILVSSYPLSPPFPFDHNYTRRRVKWGEHGMGTIQHWLTTGTPFKSQKILFKTRALGSNLKYISASNIRPALPSYMNYFISLLSSHLLWASPRASRGSAIHVFLVRGVRKLCNRSLQTGKWRDWPGVFCKLWSCELWIASCELLVAICQLLVASNVKLTSCSMSFQSI